MRRPDRGSAPRRLVHRASATVALALAVASLAAFPLLRPVVLDDDTAVARAMGPLPACRYDDILTSPRGYRHWSTTLVDTILMVPRTYVPPDLVPVSQAGIEGFGKVRQVMIADLRAMADDARSAGAGIGVRSAYRSYEQQRTTFRYWIGKLGRAEALRVSARPGHSEHQLGLAIDFRSESGGSPFEGDWGLTPAGRWMAANAWRYGFVMSYPKGELDVACYEYEPWHFRYLGRELAMRVHDSGLTIREYLWANYTTAVVPPPSGEPLPTYAPTQVPTESPISSASPSPEPSPTAAPTPSPSPTPSAEPTPAAPSAEPTPSPAASPSPGVIGALGPTGTAAAIVGFAALSAAILILWRRGRFGAVL